jgi:hypothetical protein
MWQGDYRGFPGKQWAAGASSQAGGEVHAEKSIHRRAAEEARKRGAVIYIFEGNPSGRGDLKVELCAVGSGGSLRA